MKIDERAMTVEKAIKILKIQDREISDEEVSTALDMLYLLAEIHLSEDSEV